MTSTRTAARFVRAAVLVVVLLVVPVPLALAAGTGGIEITPVPSQVDGKAVTVFRVGVPREGSVQVPYLLSNVEDGPRTARVYVARVRKVDGNFSLDDEGSSPYVSMEDRSVTLEAEEVREETFRVAPGPDGPPDDEAYAAVVVEVRNGSVVQRANTLIYLTGEPRVPLPLLILIIAVLLIGVVGAGVAVTVRRRRPA
ncbi:MAG: hypothetical protein ACYDAN_16735 [Candidatus Limnocylindrales bacterium]